MEQSDRDVPLFPLYPGPRIREGGIRLVALAAEPGQPRGSSPVVAREQLAPPDREQSIEDAVHLNRLGALASAVAWTELR